MSIQTAAPVFYIRKDKSLLVAYILLIVFSVLGIHKFYLGKWMQGLLYIITGGWFGLAIIWDLFTLYWQVRSTNVARRVGLA